MRFKDTTSNVKAVIRSDILRLSRSIVSIICVFGLAFIPCLYAWFNIMSNWNPYTSDSTKNMKIAVVSEDEGTDFLGAYFDIGDIIIERLGGNNQIDWQFPKDKADLMEGLNGGDYYAGLLIPKTFSADVLGFTDGSVEAPKIIYYENQKKNAVASKLTNRAQSMVQDRINSIFLATIVDKLSSFASVFTGFGLDAEQALDNLDNELSNIRSDLNSYTGILDSMATITQSAATVTTMTNDLLPDIVQLLANSRTSLSNMQDRLKTTKENVVYSADAIRNASEEIRNAVERIDNKVDGDPAGAGDAYIDWDALFGEAGINEYEGEILDDLYYDVNNQLRDSAVAFDNILQQTNIDSNLIASISTLQKSLSNLDSLVAAIESDIGGTSMTLGQYTSALNSCTASINGTKDVMNTMLNLVDTVQSTVSTLRNSDGFKNIVDLFDYNIDDLVDYLGSPANLDIIRVYPIENFGSGTAPFYTTLSIYASALLAVSLMSTHVKRKGEFADLTNAECYFGRFFTFFAIGQFTALITTLGVLYYIGIQCFNPFLFWLAAAVTSLLFCLINYGFVYAFGNIGEALSIITLVIQVAGSGGTYPIETLPKFFRNLYNIMPFKYSMNAMRETIGGMYNGTYIKCILVLLLMCAIMVIVGLVGRKLFMPIYEYFEKSKEKTKIMHGG